MQKEKRHVGTGVLLAVPTRRERFRAFNRRVGSLCFGFGGVAFISFLLLFSAEECDESDSGGGGSDTSTSTDTGDSGSSGNGGSGGDSGGGSGGTDWSFLADLAIHDPDNQDNQDDGGGDSRSDIPRRKHPRDRKDCSRGCTVRPGDYQIPREEDQWEDSIFKDARDKLNQEGVTSTPDDPTEKTSETVVTTIISEFKDTDGFKYKEAQETLEKELEKIGYKDGDNIPRGVLAEVMCAGVSCSGGTPEERISELYDLGITAGRTVPENDSVEARARAFEDGTTGTNGHVVAFFGRIRDILDGGDGDSGDDRSGDDRGGGGRGRVVIPPPSTPSPTIYVDGPSNPVAEDGRTAGFRVYLSHAYHQAVSVTVATEDGTATGGNDYEHAYGRLTIPAGRSGVHITPRIYDDPNDEPDETFSLVLSDPSTNSELSDAPEATATIADNDEPPLNVPGNVQMGCSATGDTYTLTGSWNAVWRATRYNYNIFFETITDDYSTLVAASSPTWRSFTEETTSGAGLYWVRVFSTRNLTEWSDPAIMGVLCAPEVSLTATELTVDEGDSIQIEATLNGSPAGTASVWFSTTGATNGDGSCAADADFRVSDPKFTFTGTTSASVTLYACDDADTDDETVTLALTTVNISGLHLGEPTTVVISIDDDDTAYSGGDDWGL